MISFGEHVIFIFSNKTVTSGPNAQLLPSSVVTTYLISPPLFCIAFIEKNSWNGLDDFYANLVRSLHEECEELSAAKNPLDVSSGEPVRGASRTRKAVPTSMAGVTKVPAPRSMSLAGAGKIGEIFSLPLLFSLRFHDQRYKRNIIAIGHGGSFDICSERVLISWRATSQLYMCLDK